MRTLTRLTALLFSLTSSGMTVAAQSVPDLRFGGHALGETAEVFFASATASGSKAKTTDYCKSLLNDPKIKQGVQDAKDTAANGGAVVVYKKDFAVLDVPGCNQVMAALRGGDANVGARLASELGVGNALFASGKVSAFNLFVDSSYVDVVADMEKRFGRPGQKQTIARVGWPVLEEMRWEADAVLAAVRKNEYSQGSIIFVGYLQPPYDTFVRGTPASPEAAKAVISTPARLSSSPQVFLAEGVALGLLVHRVQPTYPEPAKQNRIQGKVVLDAFVGKDGRVNELKPVSGPDELTPAAVEAVRQWQYRPYLVAGQPTEFATRVTVNFALAH